MKRDKLACSIWDLDPRECEEHDYEEYQELFLAAWEYAFSCRPAADRIDYYLHRYFRFRVIPPWVASYVREVQMGEAIDNIANAPLDPVVDLRLFPWHLLTVVICLPGLVRDKRNDTRLEA